MSTSDDSKKAPAVPPAFGAWLIQGREAKGLSLDDLAHLNEHLSQGRCEGMAVLAARIFLPRALRKSGA